MSISPSFSASRLAMARRNRYMGRMSRAKRSDDWGFPRWRAYGQGREAQQVRLCDRHGCSEPGNCPAPKSPNRSEEHTSELQSLMRISYAVFCLKKKKKRYNTHTTTHHTTQ